jgi:hypothetical protein
LTIEAIMADIVKFSDLATSWVLGVDAGIEFIATDRNYFFTAQPRNYFFTAQPRNYFFTAGG